MNKTALKRALGAALGSLAASPALAAGIDGAALSFLWSIPFIGMLLSIAIFPLANPHFWEHHQGKIAAFWACLLYTSPSPRDRG